MKPQSNSADKTASGGCCVSPCSLSLHSLVEGIPLPNQHGGIEKLANSDGLQSWIPKGANLVFGSDLAPGLDFVILLESPDGIINRCRIILAVVGQADAPRIIEQSGASCRLSVLWNEVEIVDCVLLPFNSRSSLAALLGQLVGGLSHLEGLVLKSSTNVKAHPRGQEEPEKQTGCFPASDGASCWLFLVFCG